MNYNWSLYSPYTKNIISQKKKNSQTRRNSEHFYHSFLRWQKLDPTFVSLVFFYENLKRFKFTWKSYLPWKCIILGLRLFFLFS